jgi:predicted aldo/keto reductase-like oxidoreductase
MKRRELFRAGFAALLTSLLGDKSFGRNLFQSSQKPLLKRPYKEGIDLSIIGFGGIVVVGMEQKEANKTVADSIDAGVNYFDVAPSYWDGEAEEKLGKALKPHRKNIFLACKTTERDAKGAANELEISLKRVGVDYFDLYQFHAVTEMEEVEQIFAPDGAVETFVKAQKEGKIRFIGFSAHSEEAALALLDRFGFDSVLFPINFVNYAHSNFGPRVVDKAKEKKAAILALKALAHTPWPEGAEEEEKIYSKCWYKPVVKESLAEKALRFTLSQDITAAIPPGDERLYQMALNLAQRFKPMTDKEIGQLMQEAKGTPSLFPI